MQSIKHSLKHNYIKPTAITINSHSKIMQTFHPSNYRANNQPPTTLLHEPTDASQIP